MTILQEPSNYYPAYNDSYIKFKSIYTQDDRAVIEFTDTSDSFTIYPDANGEYLFNMKHVVTAYINPNKFKDNLDTSGVGWGYSVDDLHAVLNVKITTYGDGASESLTTFFSFIKAVKQYGDKQFNTNYELLLPTDDGINYYVRYFEGYPFDISFRQLVNVNSIEFYNKRTEETSTAFSPGNYQSFRVVLDKGLTNWSESDVLQLPSMLNPVDILIDGNPAMSIDINTEASRHGVYLKWFNADGSYSYWLFKNWYMLEHSASEYDRIATNNFTNIYDNAQGTTAINGKSGESSMKVKSLATEEDFKLLKSLITSPYVQMWSEYEPYKAGHWVDVKVTTKNLKYNSKKYKNQVEIEIELPEANTQTL